MIVLKAPTHWIKASAITVFPFVLVSSRVDARSRARLMLHESVHYEQQKRWAKVGGVGLLAWFALYLFALPCGWNPWRRKWETEAYRACDVDAEDIDVILSKAPYFLWR